MGTFFGTPCTSKFRGPTPKFRGIYPRWQMYSNFVSKTLILGVLLILRIVGNSREIFLKKGNCFRFGGGWGHQGVKKILCISSSELDIAHCTVGPDPFFFISGLAKVKHRMLYIKVSAKLPHLIIWNKKLKKLLTSQFAPEKKIPSSLVKYIHFFLLFFGCNIFFWVLTIWEPHCALVDVKLVSSLLHWAAPKTSSQGLFLRLLFWDLRSPKISS